MHPFPPLPTYFHVFPSSFPLLPPLSKTFTLLPPLRSPTLPYVPCLSCSYLIPSFISSSVLTPVPPSSSGHIFLFSSFPLLIFPHYFPSILSLSPVFLRLYSISCPPFQHIDLPAYSPYPFDHCFVLIVSLISPFPLFSSLFSPLLPLYLLLLGS